MGAWIVWDEEAGKYISVDICKPVVRPKLKLSGKQ